MDIKQKIEDNSRNQKDSTDKLKHWRKRHAELELHHVEWVLFRLDLLFISLLFHVCLPLLQDGS